MMRWKCSCGFGSSRVVLQYHIVALHRNVCHTADDALSSTGLNPGCASQVLVLRPGSLRLGPTYRRTYPNLLFFVSPFFSSWQFRGKTESERVHAIINTSRLRYSWSYLQSVDVPTVHYGPAVINNTVLVRLERAVSVEGLQRQSSARIE
jgi:hypothetical protein